MPVQLKLLQVLQERTFTSVGSYTKQRFSGRVIAATNRSLSGLREQGRFRNDFFYRLCSDIITVPPLRHRIEESTAELELLVDLLIARLTGDRDTNLIDMVLEAFKKEVPSDYPWPGNVRELEQAVRRVLLTGSYIAEDVGSAPEREDDITMRMRAGTMSAKELVGSYCGMLYQQFGTYEEVARRTGLDRRTVKKHLLDQ